MALSKTEYVQQGESKVWYQGILKATVFWVWGDLKFKISEGSDQNWSCPESAQLAVSAKLRQPKGQFGPSLLKGEMHKKAY